ncbi:hypothetical protein GGQ04_002719 [Salinibacter ruber]|uniref:hypothetical protein n=1 Tax=Salinibacter ruber TaxID=146919 RepID=UPI002168EAC4|nr:hypothetical protein [Salinibacter ruber]MCS4047570.1 hypothetical protein [Salinibacter ruber]
MSQPEYIAALLSIIVGLALTDLAQSFRELVRPQRKVNWHWLPLLWATNMFFLAIQLWWNSFALLTEATSTFFFPFLLTFLLLYLACAFALPDPGWRKSQPRGDAPGSRVSVETLVTEPSLDLKAFHFSKAHRWWFFGILIGSLVAGQVGTQVARALAEGFSASRVEMLVNGGAAVLLGTLGLTDRWWVHAPLSVLSFLFLVRSTVLTVLGG